MGHGLQAVFFDIDGTLRVYGGGGIPKSAKQALEKAREAGLKLMIATGRHALEIEEENLLEGILFDGYVTLNGQYCYDSGGVIYKNPIDAGQVAEVVRMLGEEPFPCIFMEADRMYINLVDETVQKAQAEIGTRVPPLMDARRALGQEIYQIVPYAGPGLEERLMGRLPLCRATRWHDSLAFDITPATGSKWLGIEKMAEALGFSAVETAAVGDGSNDVEMIRCSGVGIAMGDGKAEAKEAADYVAKPVGGGGLADAMEYLFGFMQR